MTLQDTAPSYELVARLASLLPGLMEQSAVPGLAMALIRKGAVLWSGGFGVRLAGTGEPVTTTTVFEAASLSKPVFAYAVLQLVQQGHLTLDASLTSYLPAPYLPDEPRLPLITARHVLSHTTGFPNWRQDQPLTVRREPGARFGYSGEGYVYLQRMVEHITGQPLHEHMQRYVLDPLGMRHSSYVWREEFDLVAAIGHDADGKPRPKLKPQVANAAFSLHTTAPDFATFLTAIRAPSEANGAHPEGSGAARLSRPMIEQMLSPQIKLSDALSWGLGWGLQHTADGDSFWHWGDNNVFQAHTVCSRTDRLGLAILTNGQNGSRIVEEVVQAGVGGEQPGFSMLRDLERFLA